MTRTRFLAASMCVGLCIPFVASAATTAELQTLLAQLQAQLVELQQRAVSQATPSTPPAPPIPITRTLSRGMSGEDVRAVQQFLISQGLLSADSATGFFGALTENAVKQWQSTHNIASYGTPQTTGYGSVGPRTRAAMAQVGPGTSTQSTGQPAQGAYTVTVSPSYSQTTNDTTACELPWGGKVGIGSIVKAYKSPSAAIAAACDFEERKCENGVLSGSYGYQSCTGSLVSSLLYAEGSYYSQGGYSPATCTFNGQTIISGAGVTAYQSSSVAYGSSCTSQSRTCTNGSLSGSYTNQSCTEVPAASQTYTNVLAANGNYMGAYQLYADGYCRWKGHPQGAASFTSVTKTLPSGYEVMGYQYGCADHPYGGGWKYCGYPGGTGPSGNIVLENVICRGTSQLVTSASSASITPNKTSYAAGEFVAATWNINGQTYAYDWVTILPRGTGWVTGASYPWQYTGGTAFGTATLTAPSAGEYDLVLYQNDGTTQLARTPITVGSSSGIPEAHPIVSVEFENTSLAATGLPGSSVMPYLSSLTKHGVLLANYYANVHPSVPNYHWQLSGGLPGGVNYGNAYCDRTVSDDNLFRQLIARGISFRVYIEGLSPMTPQDYINCSAAMQASPVEWGFAGPYSDIRAQSTAQQNVEFVDFSQFASDVANHRLAAINFVRPDARHAGEDETPGLHSDPWLQSNLPPLLNTADFQPGGKGVLIVTWDEGKGADTSCSSAGGTTCGGHMATVLYGPTVKQGYISNTYVQHQHILRLMMEMLGFWSGFPQAATTAPDLPEVFLGL